MMASAQNMSPEASSNLDQLSFRDKMKFFEKEIKAKSDSQPAKPSAKQFSYLAEHEIAKLKQEEATKTANMSSEQLRSYVASRVADMRPDHDLDHVLSSLATRRTSNLETDVSNMAVNSKDQMSQHFSQGSNPASKVSTNDRAFPDGGDNQSKLHGSSQSH